MLATIRRRFFLIVISVVIFSGVFLYSDAAMAKPFPTKIISPSFDIVGISDLQASQFTEHPAILVGPRENFAIALYIRPAPNQQPVGYGMSGDAVTVTDQFGDYLMEDDPSATWSHIRLEKPPYTEGWLRGRFLSMSPADSSVRE